MKLRRTRICVLLLVLLGLLAGCGDAGQGPPGTQNTPSKVSYIVTDEPGLLAVRASDGKILWSHYPQTPPSGSIPHPSHRLTRAGNLLFWNSPQMWNGPMWVAAVDITNGKQLWKQSISGVVEYTAATEKYLYVMAEEAGGGMLYAFDSHTGGLKWRNGDKGDHWESSLPFILQKEIIYIYSPDHNQVVALNGTNGQELWHFDPQSNPNAPVMPSSVTQLSLVNDGKTLIIDYATDAKGAIFAVNTETHQQVWSMDLVKYSNDGGIGYNEHALSLEGTTFLPNNLLFTCEKKRSQCGLYDLTDGKLRWSMQYLDRGTYVAGQDGIFAITGPTDGDLTAFSLKDGKQLWSKPGVGSYSKLSAMAGVLLAQTETNAIDALNTKDGTPLWKAPDGAADTIVIVQDALYFVRNTSASSSDITAIDTKNGHKRWSLKFHGSAPYGDLLET